MFGKKADNKIDSKTYKKIDKYMNLLSGMITPISIVFEDMDNEIDDCRTRMKLKMAYLRLIANTIGIRKDSIEFLFK